MTSSGRTLAIGDIHGSDVALEKLLEALSPSKDDTLVILGDIVDRGPGSRESIDQLLAVRDQCRLILIQGNHEQMMLEALDGSKRTERGLMYGGTATLFSYGGSLDQVPQRHVEFLKSALDYWESGPDRFVHANLEPGVPLEKQDPEWLRWTHLAGTEKPFAEGVRVICGHTPQKSGNPLVLPGWVGIDTFAWGSGWLTGLDVSSGEFVQTTQSGQSRSGRLAVPANE